MRPLIGNRASFAFETFPVYPSWELHFPPEQAAWAGLAIWVGGKNLCLHVDPDVGLSEYLHVPLGPLADWFARSLLAITFEERAGWFPTSTRLHDSVRAWAASHAPADVQKDDWTDMREVWWARHFLQAGAEGAWLPNLALVRDDEHLVLDWEPPHWGRGEARLALHPYGSHAAPWTEASRVIHNFIEQVGAWIDDFVGPIYSWIQDRNWYGTLSDRAELFSGRPYEQLSDILGLQNGLSDLGLASDDDPAIRPELQVLRDLSPAVSDPVAGVLRELSGLARFPDDDARLTRDRSRARALDAARAGATPEAAGQQAAVSLRRVIGLDAQPIPDISPVLGRVGLTHRHFDVQAGSDRMMVMKEVRGTAVAGTLQTVRTLKPWGQRFEAARAIGHVLLDPERDGAIGAAAGPFAQRTRRRRSGAFAAELLVPENALAAASAGALDGAAEDARFESLMEEYGVGAQTAAFQLWNRGWLSSVEIRDELIGRYAAVRWG